MNFRVPQVDVTAAHVSRAGTSFHRALGTAVREEIEQWWDVCSILVTDKDVEVMLFIDFHRIFAGSISPWPPAGGWDGPVEPFTVHLTWNYRKLQEG